MRISGGSGGAVPPRVAPAQASLKGSDGRRCSGVKLVDRRPDGEVRLLRESVVALNGAGTVGVSFAPLAYAFDAGSVPGLVVAGASLPGYRSPPAALAGTVSLVREPAPLV